MRKRFISLEGHGDEPDFSEDDTATGTDPADPSIADGDDATPTEDVDAASLGGDDTDLTADNAISDDDAEEKEKQEKADAEVELTDTSDLGVAELDKLTDKADLKEEKKQIKDELSQIETGQNDLIILNEACEGYRRVMAGLQSDRGHEVSTLKYIRTRHGLPNITAALEDASGVRYRQVACEGFKETFKLIVEKIIAAIKRVFEYIRKMLRTFFDKNVLIRKSIAQANEALIKLNDQKGRDLQSYLQRKSIDTDRYVNDAKRVKMLLSVKGQFIDRVLLERFDSYGRPRGTQSISSSEMLERSIAIIDQTKFFTTAEVKEFVEGLKDLVKNVKSMDFSTNRVAKLDPQKLVQPDAHRVQAIENYVCPADKILVVSDGYLGDIIITSEFGTTRVESEMISCLNFFADWKHGFLHGYHEEANSFLPRLDVREIQSITTGMMKINAAVEDLRDTTEDYETLTRKVEVAMEAAKSEIRTELSENISREDVLRQHSFIAASKAAMSWLRNSSETFDCASFHGYNLQLAWARFLAQQLSQDIVYIKAMNTQS